MLTYRLRAVYKGRTARSSFTVNEHKLEPGEDVLVAQGIMQSPDDVEAIKVATNRIKALQDPAFPFQSEPWTKGKVDLIAPGGHTIKTWPGKP